MLLENLDYMHDDSLIPAAEHSRYDWWGIDDDAQEEPGEPVEGTRNGVSHYHLPYMEVWGGTRRGGERRSALLSCTATTTTQRRSTRP